MRLFRRRTPPFPSDARLLHPEWLDLPAGQLPSCHVVVRDTPLTEDDRVLAARILGAFGVGRQYFDESDQSALWEIMKQRFQGDLHDALNRNDPDALAGLLASMFRRSYVRGMFVRGEYDDPVTQQWLPLQTMDVLAGLAEYLALVPVDNAEQGRLGASYERGIKPLVEAVEDALGQSVGMPSVGAPWGTDLAGRVAVPRTIRHLYTARRLRDAVREYLGEGTLNELDIVEIGAGFGGVARCVMNQFATGVTRYTIVDLPQINVIQAYFLASTLGSERVVLAGESEPRNAGPVVRIWPTRYALERLREQQFDVLLNEDSLPEIPRPAGERYLQAFAQGLKGFFLSINQESESPVGGERQPRVTDLAKASPLMRRHRQLCWIRPGYVEEIYQRK